MCVWHTRYFFDPVFARCEAVSRIVCHTCCGVRLSHCLIRFLGLILPLYVSMTDFWYPSEWIGSMGVARVPRMCELARPFSFNSTKDSTSWRKSARKRVGWILDCLSIVAEYTRVFLPHGSSHAVILVCGKRIWRSGLAQKT